MACFWHSVLKRSHPGHGLNSECPSALGLGPWVASCIQSMGKLVFEACLWKPARRARPTPCRHGRPGLRDGFPARPSMAALWGRTAAQSGKTESPGHWPSLPSPAWHCEAGRCQMGLRDDNKTGWVCAADSRGGVTAGHACKERDLSPRRGPSTVQMCLGGFRGILESCT